MKVLVYLLCIIMIASAAEQFTIWKTDSERSYEGLLMVSINGAARKNVCRHYSSYYWYPSTATAELICKKLGFHRLVATDNTGSNYPFRTHYSSGMYYLRGCNPTCSYSSSSGCTSTSYYTQISCGCSGSFYVTAKACVPCPANSVNASGIVDRCACEAGMYWEHGHCKDCPAYKYSAANSTNCTQCPNGATSTLGSDHCVCFAGLYKEGEQCRGCGDNTFSVRNSTSCNACPENSTVSPDHSACVCQGSSLWNPAGNNCTETVKRHPEELPSNTTTTAPSNNTTQPGNTTENITRNNNTRNNNKQTPTPQAQDRKTRVENPHPVTIALLIVILVAVLACLIAIMIRKSWRKTKEPARMVMGALQERDLPSGPPPQPPTCCADEEGIYVDQD